MPRRSGSQRGPGLARVIRCDRHRCCRRDPREPPRRASMNHTSLSPGQIAQVACLLEATARKPGNVHRFRDFDDSHYLDYLLSASVIAGPLDRGRELGVGAAVLQAVEMTRRVTATNTNLGMLLLLAPLAVVPDGVD